MPRIDLRKCPGSFLEAGDALGDVSNLLARRDRLRVELLERLADLGHIRTAQGNLCEHGIEGACSSFAARIKASKSAALLFRPATRPSNS